MFDRYFPNTIKTFTRMQWAGSSRAHKLTPEMPAPAKEQALTNTKNPVECHACRGTSWFTFLQQCNTKALSVHKSTAGVGDVPVEIGRGVRIDQHDLCSSHEEADIHITQHAIALRLLGKSVNVVFDNKDVFVLLVHFYNSQFKASTPPPQCSCHHQWKNEQWSIFLPLQKHTVT